MGRHIDLDQPLSEEDKGYLRSRGRSRQIHANERRFGIDGNKTPAEHEAAGIPSGSVFYDNPERERAVYDQGGAPLPGTVLNYDTGRALDRDNGQFVDPTPPVALPGHFAHRVESQEGFVSMPEDGNVDDDINERVQSLSDEELDAELNENGFEIGEDVEREQKEDALAIFLHDKRHGTTSSPSEPVEQVNAEAQDAIKAHAAENGTKK